MKYLASIFGAIGLLWSAFLGHPVASQPAQTFGATVNTLPTIVANYQDSLAVAEGTSDTSFTLVSGQDSLARALSGFYCFTVDPNTSIAEYECGTASSTSVTGVIRGVDPVNPNATSSALIFAHRRGAAVVISDYTPIASINRMLQGIDTLPSGTVLQYNPNVTNAEVGAVSNNIASVGYVASTSYAGTVNGSPIQKGIYQEATTSTIANGSTTGSTGADLVLAQNVASTTGVPYFVPENTASGTLSQSEVSGTAYTFTNPTFTGNTSTFSNATSGVLTTNGSGTVSSVQPGASGNYLQSNGTNWISAVLGSPARYISPNFATTTAGGATTSTLATLTLPAGTTSTIYLIQVYLSDNGEQIPTSTLTVNGTALLGSCALPTSGSTGAQIILTAQNSTSSEFETGYSFCSTSNVGGFASLNLGTTTVWKLFGSTPSGNTLNGALSIYTF